MASTARPDTLRFVAADVTGETHVIFLLFLLSGEPNLFRVDDNNKISGVDVWRENRFSFPAQQVGSFHRDAAEHLILGVNDPPLARHFDGFGGKRFHLRKRARKVWAGQGDVNPSDELIK